MPIPASTNATAANKLKGIRISRKRVGHWKPPQKKFVCGGEDRKRGDLASRRLVERGHNGKVTPVYRWHTLDHKSSNDSDQDLAFTSQSRLSNEPAQALLARRVALRRTLA